MQHTGYQKQLVVFIGTTQQVQGRAGYEHRVQFNTPAKSLYKASGSPVDSVGRTGPGSMCVGSNVLPKAEGQEASK